MSKESKIKTLKQEIKSRKAKISKQNKKLRKAKKALKKLSWARPDNALRYPADPKPARLPQKS